MADSLLLTASEAKILHAINLLLILERFDATRRDHDWNCVYSRAVLLAYTPVAALSTYGLYRLFRPT